MPYYLAPQYRVTPLPPLFIIISRCLYVIFLSTGILQVALV